MKSALWYNYYMNKELPTALVAADICVLRVINGVLCVYVTKVKRNEVYLGMNCLPGSLIYLTESADDTVKRVIAERTTLSTQDIYTEQLYSFSDIQRDKRSRSVSIAYLGVMDRIDTMPVFDDEKGGFVPIKKVKNLAFDHKEIITLTFERLVSKLQYSTIIKKMIRSDFTFTELQQVYETILGKVIDKRNFRKKINSLDVLKETGKYKKEGRMRPAMLYTWKKGQIEFFDVFGLINSK